VEAIEWSLEQMGQVALPEGRKDVEQEIGLDRKLKGFANRRRTQRRTLESGFAHCALATWTGMLLQRGRSVGDVRRKKRMLGS